MKQHVFHGILALTCLMPTSSISTDQKIIHDAEYYILYAQNGE